MTKTISVDRFLCDDIKKRGAWTPSLCSFCRCRRKCKDNPDNNPVTIETLTDTAEKIFDKGAELQEQMKGNRIKNSLVMGVDEG